MQKLQKVVVEKAAIETTNERKQQIHNHSIIIYKSQNEVRNRFQLLNFKLC